MPQTLIHDRVNSANSGKNPTAIIKLKSGWVVLGDDQTIPGYCILLSDPVRESINDLDSKERKQFLLDMTLVGDALLTALGVKLINYSILGNTDRALHVHIHPRYDWEKDEFKKMPPWVYHFKNHTRNPFNLERDKILIEKIRATIEKLL